MILDPHSGRPGPFCLATASLGTRLFCPSFGHATLALTTSRVDSACQAEPGAGAGRVSHPSRRGASSLKSGLGAELSWEGLFVLVDISEGCWASLVLWLSRHSRLPPGTKFRVPRILAGPRPGFGKSPFCSSCCRRPRLGHSQMTVLPGVHSLAPAWIDPADVISSRPAGLASSRRPGARGSPPHRGPLTKALGFALALGEQMAPSPFSSEPCKNKKLKDPQV